MLNMSIPFNIYIIILFLHFSVISLIPAGIQIPASTSLQVMNVEDARLVTMATPLMGSGWNMPWQIHRYLKLNESCSYFTVENDDSNAMFETVLKILRIKLRKLITRRLFNPTGYFIYCQSVYEFCI